MSSQQPRTASACNCVMLCWPSWMISRALFTASLPTSHSLVFQSVHEPCQCVSSRFGIQTSQSLTELRSPTRPKIIQPMYSSSYLPGQKGIPVKVNRTEERQSRASSSHVVSEQMILRVFRDHILDQSNIRDMFKSCRQNGTCRGRVWMQV